MVGLVSTGVTGLCPGGTGPCPGGTGVCTGGTGVSTGGTGLCPGVTGFTWTVVVPGARPCSTPPSRTWSTSGSTTLSEEPTRWVTSTCRPRSSSLGHVTADEQQLPGSPAAASHLPVRTQEVGHGRVRLGREGRQHPERRRLVVQHAASALPHLVLVLTVPRQPEQKINPFTQQDRT